MASKFRVLAALTRATTSVQAHAWTSNPLSVPRWANAAIASRACTNAADSKLPDPYNPAENPLATLGDDELTDVKKYWRKRQSETPPPVYDREVDENGVAFGIGRRKASVARVSIELGNGNITVNGRDWIDYFPRIDHRDQILRPLLVLSSAKGNAFSINCDVFGGGITGQAEAIRHGLARALVKWDPKDRPILKRDGLLTRDSRVVEQKKYGRKKARKSFTWVKR